MTEPRWLDDAERRAWVNFLDASRLLEERIGQQLRRDHGMTHREYEVLVRLEDAPGRRMRLADLAAATVASRPRLTYVIDRLSKRGWVRRESVQGDARGYYAVLDDAGLAALRSAAPGHVDTVRGCLVDPLSREQVDAVADAMEALAARLRADRPDQGCGGPGAGGADR